MRLTSLPPAQTSIVTDGFRSLADGEQVEFYVESGDDGRTKAVQVTGPGGAPPQGASRPHRANSTLGCTLGECPRFGRPAHTAAEKNSAKLLCRSCDSKQPVVEAGA